ncbi:hypothetical protein H4R34_001876 [Dimargaris verticillata]|uniref:mRNA stability protein n=1 Tax=Dimargaris verticillata TaxID=2761393 RepID=A0A9W8BAI4_9FUNG|nr:hypothetical protein H4R34_001876 [Dimargaris verticillata]
MSKMSEEEKKLFRLYGKLPNRKDLLHNKLKERKYFDSGDYVLSKVGKNSQPVGEQHPSPANIPHQNPALHPVPPSTDKVSSSPVKETSPTGIRGREPSTGGNPIATQRPVLAEADPANTAFKAAINAHPTPLKHLKDPQA